LNGGVKGDEERRWTYIGEWEKSVIVYVIIKGEQMEKVDRLKIEERMESDYIPVVIRVKKKGKAVREGGEGV